MPASGTPTGGTAGKAPQRKLAAAPLLMWLVLGCVSVVMFLTWMYMHHTVTAEHVFEHEVLTNSRVFATEQQLGQVQRLLEETRGLLRAALTGNSPDATNKTRQEAVNLALRRVIEKLGGSGTDKGVANGGVELNSATSPLVAAEVAALKQQLEAEQKQVAGLRKSLEETKSKLKAVPPVSATEFGAGAGPGPGNGGASQVGVAAGGGMDGQKWLVIGIPSVPRTNDEDYLLHTLEALARQLPRDPADLMYLKIAVLVVNVHDPNGKTHRRFNEARALYSPGAHPMGGYFFFSELSAEEHGVDPNRGATAENDLGNANVPGYRVRKQTRNVAAVMHQAAVRFPDGVGRYYMFLEDDMLLCKHGFTAIEYLLQKSSRYHPNWLAIRASYGMNGIFLNMRDVPVFAAYLIKHQLRRPPDHLVVEWFAGETPEAKAHKGARANVGFRHNIFDHIGTLSSLRREAQTSFPRCYELLAEPTVFKVEAFNPMQCPRDDIWPCRNIMGGVPDKVRLALEGLGPTSG